jgi:FKBP-type peptidyl-prolyl cis-trans isomerase FkpA
MILLGRIIPLIALLALVSACGSADSSSTAPTTSSAPYSQIDLVVGTGATATTGRSVTVNYALWLYDSTKADGKGQQIPQNPPTYSFVLGGVGVIQGWNQGVVGMRVGGQRRLTIPPELAYGSSSPGPGIPANATLVFEITLTAVQ